MNIWLQGRWPEHCQRGENQVTHPQLLGAQVWEHMQKDPIEARRRPSERLLETQAAAKVRRYFSGARKKGEVIVLYGPPGSEKSFLLEQLVAEREAAGRDDAIYVTCSASLAPLALLQMLCQELGTPVRSNQRWPLTQSIVREIERRGRRLAIVVDEAQHLTLDALETLREIHDRTSRHLEGSSGVGIIVAGSHDLLARLKHPRMEPKLEQWWSRFDLHAQLTGMSEEEVLLISARELGNGRPAKLSDQQRDDILKACRRLDVYATDSSGKPAPREYFSCRRLAKFLDQMKERLAGRRKEHAA